MANQKISAMSPASTPLTGTETVSGVQSSANVKIKTSDIAALAPAPTGANPTATAGPAAVNGVAATFMRSDGAPAVQLGSASVPGLLQGDGSTVSITAGVISIPAATTTQPGQVKVTGKSIKATAGVISAQVPPAIIRGFKAYAPGSVSSATVTFSDFSPAVPQAGDLMIINAGGGFLPSGGISGFTLISDGAGSNWQTQTFGKILTSGDISTGTVSITFTGTFNAFVGAICFQGNTQGITGTSENQNSGGGPTYKPIGLGIVGSIVAFVSGRFGPTTITCNNSAFTQETLVTDSSACTGAIFFANGNPFFGSQAQFTFGHTTSGADVTLIGVADTP